VRSGFIVSHSVSRISVKLSITCSLRCIGMWVDALGGSVGLLKLHGQVPKLFENSPNFLAPATRAHIFWQPPLRSTCGKTRYLGHGQAGQYRCCVTSSTASPDTERSPSTRVVPVTTLVHQGDVLELVCEVLAYGGRVSSLSPIKLCSRPPRPVLVSSFGSLAASPAAGQGVVL
jgi:hypothetical protein